MRSAPSLLVSSTLTLALTATVTWAEVRHAPDALRPHAFTLRFASPPDWRCVDRDGCTRCLNVSDHRSRVFVQRPSAETEHLDVPSAEYLEACTQ